MESPSNQEVREIMEEYGLDPLVADELLLPTMKPKIDIYKEFVYLILHFPAFKHTHGAQSNQEVDFIIGKNFLITTRYDTIDPMHKFSKVFEVNSVLDRSNIGSHAAYIFFYMAKKLYKSLDHELEVVSDSLENIEAQIYEGREKAMVIELSKVSRTLLNFKEALGPHREILQSLHSFVLEDRTNNRFFDQDFTRYSQTIIGEYYRVQNGVSAYLDSLAELRETNNSLVSTKQNEVMKVLTIMAFVTFPLSLVASIFGMNTEYLPIVGQQNDFWFIVGGMVIATTLFFIFFKYKRWL
jgi:magnesium transporter